MAVSDGKIRVFATINRELCSGIDEVAEKINVPRALVIGAMLEAASKRGDFLKHLSMTTAEREAAKAAIAQMKLL
jgi:hypothetical protein